MGFSDTLSLIIRGDGTGAVRELEKVGLVAKGTAAEVAGAGAAGQGMFASLKNSIANASVASKLFGGAVAGAFLFAGAKKAADEFRDLGLSIILVKNATGASAEDSSRLVAVLDDFNISAPKATQGFKRMSDAALLGGGAFKTFGIETRDSEDKQLGFTKVLGNVADKYKELGGGAEGAAMLTAVFGKRVGTELVDVLEKGGAGLRKFFENVPKGQILDDAALIQAREYDLAIDNMNDAMREVKVMAGTVAAPALTALFNNVADGIRVIATLRDTFDSVSDSIGDFAGSTVMGAAKDTFVNMLPGVGGAAAAVRTLGSIFKGTGDEVATLSDKEKTLAETKAVVVDLFSRGKTNSQDYTAAVKAQRDAQSDLDGANKDVASSQRDVNESTDEGRLLTLSITGGAVGLIASTQRIADANVNVTEKQVALTDAQANYAAGSPQVIKAESDLATAQINATMAVIGAEAGVIKYAQSLESSGLKKKDAIAQLQALQRTYGDNTGAIQAMIDKLGGIKDKGAKVTVDTSQAIAAVEDLIRRFAGAQFQFGQITAEGIARSRGLTRQLDGTYRADGGPVSANTPYIVGEKGPELFMPNSAGTIIPNHKLGGGGQGAGGGMGGASTVININTVAGDAAAIERVVVDALARARRRGLTALQV